MQFNDNIMACTCGNTAKYTSHEVWTGVPTLNAMCRAQGFKYMDKDWKCGDCIAKAERAADKRAEKARASVKKEEQPKPRRQQKVHIR